MITSFEVGAVFRIINEASPALRTILKQVRELSAAVDKAKANIASIGKMPSLAAATGETKALAVEWREVQKAAASANRSIGAATRRQLAGPGASGVAEAQQLATAWERVALASASATGNARQIASAARRGSAGGGGGSGGGGGGRARLGNRVGIGGGSNVHFAGPGMPIPGGGHARFSGGAAAAAGLAGYGAYEAAQMEDAVFQLIYHSGQEQNAGNRAKFRKILQDSMVESGYGLHDISESAKQEIRMFQGTKGGGIDVLPEMLRAATIESRLKGESPEESMKALIGLAHMTKQYDPEAIKKLAPAFAFLSTANPSSLNSIERAAGYAVPILQSSLGVDPLQSLLLGTALTRAGATSTKSGTWLREMALRAMPGTAIFESEKKAEHHDELLKRLGLLDKNDKPTWFTDGKPDIFKMLETAGTNLDKIPLTERAGVERKLFGAQGSGGLALLSDPAVREQVQTLRKEMDSPEFKNRYAGFVEQYEKGSTVQQARTAMQEFNVTMMDLGAHVLPPVNQALRDFKGVLEGLKSILPAPAKPEGADKWKVGTRAIEGAAAGALVGSVIPGLGTVAGGVGGGLLGGALGVLEQGDALKKGERPGDRYERRIEELHQKQQQQKTPIVNLSVNLDGKAIAQAVSESQSQDAQYPTGPAAYDPSQLYGP